MKKERQKIGIKAHQVEGLLRDTHGKMFGVTFIKKDQSLRKMNCRTGVRKYVKYPNEGRNPEVKPYVRVYDVINKGYRNVNTETVTNIRSKGKEFIVED